MFSKKNFNRSKPYIFLLILFPSLLWVLQFITGNLGVNPIERIMDEFGLMALRLIILTLMITTNPRGVLPLKRGGTKEEGVNRPEEPLPHQPR